MESTLNKKPTKENEERNRKRMRSTNNRDLTATIIAVLYGVYIRPVIVTTPKRKATKTASKFFAVSHFLFYDGPCSKFEWLKVVYTKGRKPKENEENSILNAMRTALESSGFMFKLVTSKNAKKKVQLKSIKHCYLFNCESDLKDCSKELNELFMKRFYEQQENNIILDCNDPKINGILSKYIKQYPFDNGFYDQTIPISNEVKKSANEQQEIATSFNINSDQIEEEMEKSDQFNLGMGKTDSFEDNDYEDPQHQSFINHQKN